VTPAEALERIRGLVGSNRYRIDAHARQRMRERNVRAADVRRALLEATTAALQANGRWKVDGPDVDDDELTLIVVFEEREPPLVVVTLY
jgi:hypothetical protein